MKSVLLNHPLRTIHLEYENDEAINEFESLAFQEYIRLHDVLRELISRKDAMAGELLRFEMQLDDCEEDLALLEKEILQCGPLAGYTVKELDKAGVIPGQVDLTAVIELGLGHQEKMNQWLDDSEVLHGNKKKWDDDVDVLDEMIEKFKEVYFDEIINHYEDKNMYSPALDNDIQEFYGFYDSITFRPVFLKNYEAYVKRHNEYLARVSPAFGRINSIAEVTVELLKTKSNAGFGLN